MANTAPGFPPWEKAELPAAPVFRWRRWTMLIGPGLLMVGANIGAAELPTKRLFSIRASEIS